MPPYYGPVFKMNEALMCRDRALSDLNDSIYAAARFFMKVDENLFDGHQTAREVLSHLVFWHQEYVSISKAFLLDQKPILLQGPLATLNAQATCQFHAESMHALAKRLVKEHQALDDNLRQLKDWHINFPFKKGCRKIDVAGRLCAINDHIRHHLVRQKRAYQRGEAWIEAYYSDPTT